ncbi:tripartite tricarboxylate transporter substrate binding protein [Ramlibacter sp. MAHUQ-53]|uniref:tripartite tricarboxylate transporter substrate binding protein n=1 Tax=unclassified Ramlibacter TaxID=2617605 RepID=UPI00362AA93E
MNQGISRRQLLSGLCSVAAIPAAFPSFAADNDAWPARPVRLVVPYAAGGNADATARAFATQLSERLGQQVIVDNRPGGGGTIGATAVAKAPADGYTLLLDATAFAVNPLLVPKLPYGGPSDFAPISLLTRAPLLLVVPANSPFQSVADLVRFARTKPGKLSYASAGNGGAQHLAGELFKQSAKVSITHIPYRGGAPALTDLIAGQVDLMFSATSASGPFVRAGKLRALGVTAARRAEAFPQVPTLAEQGFAEVDVAEWNGLFAPAGTPPAVLARLESEARALVPAPALSRRWAEMGVQGAGSTAAEFTRFLDGEGKRWSRVIKTAGIQLD